MPWGTGSDELAVVLWLWLGVEGPLLPGPASDPDWGLDEPEPEHPVSTRAAQASRTPALVREGRVVTRIMSAAQQALGEPAPGLVQRDPVLRHAVALPN